MEAVMRTAQSFHKTYFGLLFPASLGTASIDVTANTPRKGRNARNGPQDHKD